MGVEKRPASYLDLFSRPTAPEREPTGQPAIASRSRVAHEAAMSTPMPTAFDAETEAPDGTATGTTGLGATGLVPLTSDLPPMRTDTADDAGKTPAQPRTLFAKLTEGLDLRALTPRQMADVSLDLYAAGVLAYEEYKILAFQPELHPNYNTTIGALTGQLAEPDTPRDFVAIWEDRLNFERRHSPQDAAQVRRTERIVALLTRLDSPVEEPPTGGSGKPLAA